MGANFQPTLEGYTKLRPFRFWCQTVLPLVYDDSLSYYELLNKVVEYLNNTIKDVATAEKNIGELSEAFAQLQDYVNNYFDNLDVQTEMNEALDRMVEDGVFDAIIEQYVGETFEEFKSDVSQLQDDVSSIGLTITDLRSDLTDLDTNVTSEFGNINSAISDLEDSVNALEQLQENSVIVNVRDFGAVGDGVTDDTQAIQSAIDSLPNNGGIVIIPGGNYKITDTIEIGNGDGEGNFSTKNGIKIIGLGGGFTQSGTLVPTTIRYIGVTGDNTCAIRINGRITGVCLSNFLLYCNTAVDTGISITAISGCTFESIKIMGVNKYGIKLLGGGAPTGNFCTYNLFKQIFIGLTHDNSTGLYISGNTEAHNDAWMNTFILCRIQANADNCIGMHLGYQDSCTFIRCHFVTYGSDYTGVLFDGTEAPNFPCGNCFYDCSVHNTVVRGTIRDNSFVNHGTYDNETIPNHPNLKGVTDRGVPFGGWGGNTTTDYWNLSDVSPTLTNATATVALIESNMSEHSVARFNLWRPTYEAEDLPGTSNYIMLELVKHTNTHCVARLYDLNQNTIYVKSKYGAVWTGWQMLNSSSPN